VLLLRPARLDDEPSLRALDLQTWTSQVSPGELPRSEQPFLDAATVLADLLVAEVGGAGGAGGVGGVIVGYARLSPTTSLASNAHVLTVNGLAVAPTHQRTGVGRALLLETVGQARRRGATKVALRVLGQNLGARALYESCGFVVEGVLRGEFVLDGELVDDVLMARHLAGG